MYNCLHCLHCVYTARIMFALLAIVCFVYICLHVFAGFCLAGALGRQVMFSRGFALCNWERARDGNRAR